MYTLTVLCTWPHHCSWYYPCAGVLPRSRASSCERALSWTPWTKAGRGPYTTQRTSTTQTACCWWDAMEAVHYRIYQSYQSYWHFNLHLKRNWVQSNFNQNSLNSVSFFRTVPAQWGGISVVCILSYRSSSTLGTAPPLSLCPLLWCGRRQRRQTKPLLSWCDTGLPSSPATRWLLYRLD